jgi:hypothetical protein
MTALRPGGGRYRDYSYSHRYRDYDGRRYGDYGY